jgi:two-component SAPR family response regulator
VDRVWESVWGETDLSMTALHQALRRVRVQTRLSVAVRDGTCAIWADWDEIAYDVRMLEQILEQPLGRELVERALALYRGEFLPGAPDGALYWVETRRAHLQERLLNALEHYGATIEADQPQATIQLYQRILQIDGCREQTAVRLMQLAAQFGNRSLVTATFEHLTGALRTLGASPGATTAAIYRQLH